MEQKYAEYAAQKAVELLADRQPDGFYRPGRGLGAGRLRRAGL